MWADRDRDVLVIATDTHTVIAAAQKVSKETFLFLVNEIIGWFLCALARITDDMVKPKITGPTGNIKLSLL